MIWGALSEPGRSRAWDQLNEDRRVEALTILFDAREEISVTTLAGVQDDRQSTGTVPGDGDQPLRMPSGLSGEGGEVLVVDEGLDARGDSVHEGALRGDDVPADALPRRGGVGVDDSGAGGVEGAGRAERRADPRGNAALERDAGRGADADDGDRRRRLVGGGGLTAGGGDDASRSPTGRDDAMTLCPARPFQPLSACVLEEGHEGTHVLCRMAPVAGTGPQRRESEKPGWLVTFYRASERGGTFTAIADTRLPGEKPNRARAAEEFETIRGYGT